MTTGTSQEVYTTNGQGDNETTTATQLTELTPEPKASPNQQEHSQEHYYWERVLEQEGLSEVEADGLALDDGVLYLGIAGATAEGIDLPGEEDVELLEIESAQEEEKPQVPVGDTCPVLLPEDFEVLHTLRSRHCAATLAEARASAESIVRLAGADLAHGRVSFDGEDVGLALAGATDGDVTKALNRARAERIEDGFIASIEECEQIAETILARIKDTGVCSEKAIIFSLLDRYPREAVTAVLEELARREKIRRATNRTTGISLVASPGESQDNTTLAAAVKKLLALAKTSAAFRKLSGKTFAAEASGSRPDDDTPPDPHAAERAIRTFLKARDGGSLAVAESNNERRRIESNRQRMRAGYIERRRSGRPLVITPARDLDSRHDRRRARHERRRNFWKKVCRQTENNPEKVALDTARATLRGLGVRPETLGDTERRQALLAVLSHPGSGIKAAGRLATAVAAYRAAQAASPGAAATSTPATGKADVQREANLQQGTNARIAA